jgi:PadR family transcriptional regulator, regulatory protein AphA
VAADEPKLTTTEYAVLGLLAWREMSGYDVNRAVDNSVRFFWSPAKSRVYAVLPRLLDAGLIRRRDVGGERGTDKALYGATPSGKRALRRWLLADTDPDLVRSPFLLKLFLGDNASPTRLHELVDEYAGRTRDLLDHLRAAEAAVDASEDPYALLTIRYGIRRGEAGLQWVDEAHALVDTLERAARSA